VLPQCTRLHPTFVPFDTLPACYGRTDRNAIASTSRSISARCKSRKKQRSTYLVAQPNADTSAQLAYSGTCSCGSYRDDVIVLAIDSGAIFSAVVTGVLAVVCDSAMKVVGVGLVVVSVMRADRHLHCSHAFLYIMTYFALKVQRGYRKFRQQMSCTKRMHQTTDRHS